MADNININGIQPSQLPTEDSPAGFEAIGYKSGMTSKVPLDTLATKVELQDKVVGTNLLGSKANVATIKSEVTTPSKGDTYKATDTGNYWKYNDVISETNPYDPNKWVDIGDIVPSDAMRTGGTTKTGQQLDDELSKRAYSKIFFKNQLKLGYATDPTYGTTVVNSAYDVLHIEVQDNMEFLGCVVANIIYFLGSVTPSNKLSSQDSETALTKEGTYKLTIPDNATHVAVNFKKDVNNYTNAHIIFKKSAIDETDKEKIYTNLDALKSRFIVKYKDLSIKDNTATDINTGSIDHANSQYMQLTLEVPIGAKKMNCFGFVPYHTLFYSYNTDPYHLLGVLNREANTEDARNFYEDVFTCDIIEGTRYININIRKSQGNKINDNSFVTFDDNLPATKPFGGCVRLGMVCDVSGRSTTGNIVANSSYDMFAFKCNPNKSYTIKGAISEDYLFYSEYPSNLKTISIGKTIQNIDGTYTINTPDNCTYAAINFLKKYNTNGYANLFVLSDDSEVKNSEISKIVSRFKLAGAVPSIVCLGDSLSQLFNDSDYPTALQSIVGGNYSVIADGVGGENVSNISARAGATPILIKKGFTLPADAAEVEIARIEDAEYTNFNLLNSYDASLISPIIQHDGGFNPCYINGIECTLKYYGGVPAGVGSYWTINRVNYGASTSYVRDSSLIVTNVFRNHRFKDMLLLWIGTNGGFSDIDNLIWWQKRIIETLNPQNYIVLGLHAMGMLLNNTSGKPYDDAMLKAFGYRFFNTREYMITDALSDGGFEPTQSDIDAMEIGEMPPSLSRYPSSRDIHLNKSANTALANRLHMKMIELNYL